MDEGLAPLNRLKDELAGIEDEISQCDSRIAELQKQINDGDSLYRKYIEIPESERTADQQAYLESWSGVSQGVEVQIGNMQVYKTQLEKTKQEKLNKAGFATEADLEAQITSLTKQKADLDAKETALLQQEQELAAQEEEL